MEMGLPNLPHEIAYDILSKLPVKSLCRFKSVCKPWLAQITDPQFVKYHLRRSTKHRTNQKLLITTDSKSGSFYSLDHQAPDHTMAELEMPCESRVENLGSFSGVLLLDIGDELCLWNPSIRQSQVFSQAAKCPDSPIVDYDYDYERIYGLGYDSISDDFKVVGVVFAATTVVRVFSSKLSSWKSIIGDFSYSVEDNNPGIVLNGAPHWVWCVENDDNFPLITLSTVIVCFDATEEKFVAVPKPNFVGEDELFDLNAFCGLLCVVDNDNQSHADVWVMKEYGVKESWTKLFVVPNVVGEFFDRLQPLCDTKDGEVVMVLNSELVVYNLEQHRYERIQNPQTCDGAEVTFYMESLVSPCGCNGTKLDG